MTQFTIKPLKISAALAATLGLAMIAAPSAAAAEHCCHRSHNVAVSTQHGISVHRPGALIDRSAMQKLAVSRAKRDAAKTRARRDAADRAALTSRLERIETQNAQILASQRQNQRAPQIRRRNVYSGNPPFFGPNGFIGNSNFSGALSRN
jgi:hypothetical protein